MSCDFRSKELLEMRKAIVAGQPLTPEQNLLAIWLIDKAWYGHWKETGCECWQDAKEAA